MQSIRLRKIEGERYDSRSPKTYTVERGGQQVGYVSQDVTRKWEVMDSFYIPVSRHSTIKAAARVAGRVL